MANALYDSGRQKMLEGSIAWLTDNIKVALIDETDYTVNLATHDFLDDVAAAARVATSGNLATKLSTDGVASAADLVISAVSGDSVEAFIIYKDSGVASTSPLIAYIDTATGFPFTPDGSDVTITWDAGANKIFKL